MTTFTMQDLNNVEVTKEEDEVFKTMAETSRIMGEPLPNPTTQDVLNNLAIPQTPDINTIINNICTQLQLLSTVISKGAGKGNSLNAEDQSLQDCVSAVLENADWFEEKVREIVDSRVDDLFDSKDFDYEIEAAVNTWLNDFDFGDYVNVDEIVERIVEDKLNDATVSINF